MPRPFWAIGCVPAICFRQDHEGYLYLVGRKKDMVRRNAENIACREIEEVLRELEGIKEAAIVAVPDDKVGEEVQSLHSAAGWMDSNNGFAANHSRPLSPASGGV